MITHGHERRRRDDEGDVGDAGRVLRLARHACLKIADAVFGVMGFGRLGVVRIGASRNRGADEMLDLLILLNGRLDQVYPDRSFRDRVGRIQDPARKRGGLPRPSRRIVNDDQALLPSPRPCGFAQIPIILAT